MFVTKKIYKTKRKTKLNARLAIWQRADLSETNISANKISLP